MGTVAVLGAGSWGTALAVHLARIGHDVHLWARDPALVEDMRVARENTSYLAGVRLPDSIGPTHDLHHSLAGSDLVVSAIPSHGCRAVVRAAAPHVRAGATIVSATECSRFRNFLWRRK